MLQYKIRRRIIKTTLKVTKRGEQKVAEIFIPDNVFNVVGVMITSALRSSEPLETAKFYWGPAESGYQVTDLFYKDTGNKSVVVNYHLEDTEHFAIAIPRKWGCPYLYVNGYAGGFKNPRFETVTDPDTGYIESYQVFESNQNGLQLGGNINVELKW